MLAIHTKYISATSTRQARIKAYTCNGHSVTIPVYYDLGDVERHAAAARALIQKHLTYVIDIDEMAYGGSADGKGYSFCFKYSTIKL